MINKSRIEAVIREMFESVSFTSEPKGLYDPLRYMIEIGGKRIRPKLCLVAYNIFSDKFDEGILSPACALEVFHSFTLMHDDIMDRSPLRRGKPTVWKQWNEDTAILSGDVMLIDAYRRIAKAPTAVLDKVMELFSYTAARVCDGQQYDMDFESLPSVPMEDYNMMIGLKTAVLLACSAKMGAIIGGASQAECEALYNYGYELGMAFQVADDYLDAFGDEKVFGKPIGGDIINKKKSWLTVRALEKSDDRDDFLNKFNSVAENPEEQVSKIDTIKREYTRLGVDSDAKNEIIRFTERALNAVRDAGFDTQTREALAGFAANLVGRAK